MIEGLHSHILLHEQSPSVLIDPLKKAASGVRAHVRSELFDSPFQAERILLLRHRGFHKAKQSASTPYWSCCFLRMRNRGQFFLKDLMDALELDMKRSHAVCDAFMVFPFDSLLQIAGHLA